MINNCTPLILTNKYGNKYPEIWDKIEKMYMDNKDNLKPDYFTGMLQIVRDYRSVGKVIGIQGRNDVVALDSEMLHLPAILDATFKWRIHKQYYKFPKEFEELLYQQDGGIDTPIWILNSLPYDCIYIETNCLEEHVLGFFFYKDLKSYTAVIVNDDLSFDNGGFNYNEITTEKTTLWDAYHEQADKEGLGEFGAALAVHSKVGKLMPKILQLVLYICAENKEVEENVEQKKITRKPKSKQFIKDKYREVQIWDCGNKISEKIRTFLVRDKKNTLDYSIDREYVKGTPKAPHSRRGHWHHFWTGKVGTSERKLVLKWLSPTFVNGVPNNLNVNIVQEATNG